MPDHFRRFINNVSAIRIVPYPSAAICTKAYYLVFACRARKNQTGGAKKFVHGASEQAHPGDAGWEVPPAIRVVFHRAHPSGFPPFGVVGGDSHPIPERSPMPFTLGFCALSAKTRYYKTPKSFKMFRNSGFCSFDNGRKGLRGLPPHRPSMFMASLTLAPSWPASRYIKRGSIL
jgi:hypothetical protein